METSIDNKYTNCMPGDCVYNKKEDIAFLLVPKCATSVIRDYEKTNNDWKRITLWEEEKCPSRFIVILRDPVERFISTINMYLGWREVEPHTNYVTFNFSDEGFYLESNDAHFKPQKSFLIDMFDIIKKYNANPIIDYFYYNKNIYNQINDEYGFNIDATKRLMQSIDIVNDVNKSVVRQAYRADYDLIKSVQFKNT